MRSLHERFLNTANRDQLRIELCASVAEADALRSFEARRLQERQEHSGGGDADHWKNQTYALQLARLKLEQKLKQAERGA